MKKTFHGIDGTVGAKMDFEGNSEAGSDSLELLKVMPNHFVDIKLIMSEPMRAENFITYKLIPEAGRTRFVWTMAGDGGFIGKLMSVLIDCDAMIGGQFEKGIANLKRVVEAN